MWTYAKTTYRDWYGKNNRQYGWSIHQRQRDIPVCSYAVGVSPQGWIVYELYDQHASEYRMTLVDDNGNYVADYPLMDDEFWNHPELPRNWAIPF